MNIDDDRKNCYNAKFGVVRLSDFPPIRKILYDGKEVSEEEAKALIFADKSK